MRLARRWLPISREEHGERFLAVENGRRVITTLFLVLLVVESTDVAFAVDSVPAIFGITEEPFIVYTSNIFAILGLRALYFLLAGFMPDLFHYLKYGLSAILIFVGVKMLLPAVGVHIPAWVLAARGARHAGRLDSGLDHPAQGAAADRRHAGGSIVIGQPSRRDLKRPACAGRWKYPHTIRLRGLWGYEVLVDQSPAALHLVHRTMRLRRDAGAGRLVRHAGHRLSRPGALTAAHSTGPANWNRTNVSGWRSTASMLTARPHSTASPWARSTATPCRRALRSPRCSNSTTN